MVAAVYPLDEEGSDGGGGGGDTAGQGEAKGEGQPSESNNLWNSLYKLQLGVDEIMPSGKDSNRPCPKSISDSCPPGHELKQCKNDKGLSCVQCKPDFYQPNENWWGDSCRIKTICDPDYFMTYEDEGDSRRNAVCRCRSGYHLRNEDHNLCIPNDECPRGTEPGKYGGCEDCLPKHMYSDTVGTDKNCQPLTNCAKQKRCTLTASDGTQDNVCGPIVKDLNTCEALRSDSGFAPPIHAIALVVLGGVVVVLLLFLLFFLLRRRSLRRSRRGGKGRGDALSDTEKDELRMALLKESDRDPAFCRNLLQTSRSFIEERIGKQIWTLAQELYRTHPKQGHFEFIVQKYKASQPKYAVNGYLQEWREWRGEGKDALSDLFVALDKVDRSDIVHEVCACLRHRIDFHPGSEFGVDEEEDYPPEKQSLTDDCRYVFLPCLYPKKSASGKKKKKNCSSSCSTSKKSQQLGNSPAAVGISSKSSSGGGVGGGGNTCGSRTEEEAEAGAKLLAIATDDLDQEDGDGGAEGDSCGKGRTFYVGGHPSPSAPQLEIEEQRDSMSALPMGLDNVKFSRQYSQPVQATS